ncbi:MAG: hypothetical protein IPJ81_19475 [Chitinophagaceae bacterium]|nr:hypothetical protein [Chitinophagaceae bacterium]
MAIKRILKKTGKVFIYILCVILIIIISVVIFINTNYGKKIITEKVQLYLQKKLHTTITIASIDYRLPKWIEITGIYVEDLHKDTLLYGERLSVDLDMLKLIKGNTYIQKVEFKNIYANISRTENDSLFNYQFIINAFSGNKPDNQVNKDTAALKLTLKKLIFNNVRLNFNDKYTGTNITARIGELNAEINKFQPDRLQFEIDKFSTSGVDFSMITYKSDTSQNNSSKDTTDKNALWLTANQFDLRNVNVSVKNEVNGMYYANWLQHLSLSKTNLDMAKQTASLNTLVLDSSFIKFISPKESPKPSQDTSVSATAWNIQVNQIYMADNQLQFDNNASPIKDGLDFSHLDVKRINLNTGIIKYSADSIIADINQLAFADKSGFQIDTTHAGISYNNKGVKVRELYIRTPQSVIKNTLELEYDDIKQITAVPQNTLVNVKLDNSIIAINDLYTLMPSVKKSLPRQKFLNSTIHLNTEVRGNLQLLYVPFLQLRGFDGTMINAKAILYNVTDSKRLGYDINVFNTTIPKGHTKIFTTR